MKRKKKGSSFVIVILVMAILFTVGTTMLAVTASEYRMRINENEKIKNLYKADSGLDIVYNIILKASEASILASEKATKEESLGTNKSLEELDEIFRNKYLEILGKEADGKGKNPNDALLARVISEGKYCEFDDINKAVVLSKNSFNNANIEILEYSYLNEKIIIKVKSTFEDNTGDIKNTKAIETSYELAIPKYQKNIVNESVNRKISIYPVFDNKIITADGNMSISGEVDIEGNIWAKGDEELKENPAYAFDKYNGGISLENATLDMSGNISTNKTLHLKTKSNVEIDGDVYALNAYVGKYYNEKRELIESNNNSLNPKLDSQLNLVVNNDLAINAKNSNINLTNFYGINDKTDSINNLDKAMKSSSIIVNNIDNSSNIKIDKAYIMGVAYIDTNGEKYQTGESVAVKGNYLAYSDIIPGYEGRVTLNYYNPLQLIETIDNNKSIDSKAKYFEKYFSESQGALKTGGINLNEVHAIGAYIGNDGTAKYLGIKNEDSEEVTKAKKEFARNIYAMGDMGGIDTNEIDLYNNNNSNSNAYSKTVANQIQFSDFDLSKVTNSVYGNLILINDGNEITIGNNRIVSNVDRVNGKDVTNAVIITNGNIKITGDIDFTGNIITTGNIEFINGGKKNLVYDSEITRKIIAANYDAIEKAFEKGTSIGQVDNVNIGEITIIQDTTNGYDMKSLLSNGTWKIVK